jgi:hypothetical protein
MPTGILDALLDDIAWPVAHGQRGGEQFAQGRIGAQCREVLRIELARVRPFAHFGAETGRHHGLATERPEAFEDDRERDR